jgi:hypothetical protein
MGEIYTKEMLGFKKLPNWLRIAYFKAVDYTCEDCGLKEGETRKDGTIIKLEIHRLTEGYKGGTYRPGNVKILCNECHNHYDENW